MAGEGGGVDGAAGAGDGVRVQPRRGGRVQEEGDLGRLRPAGAWGGGRVQPGDDPDDQLDDQVAPGEQRKFSPNLAISKALPATGFTKRC